MSKAKSTSGTISTSVATTAANAGVPDLLPLCRRMNEYEELCISVHQRLIDIPKTLDNLPDASLKDLIIDYGDRTKAFHEFLQGHVGLGTLSRLWVYRKVVTKLRSFHEQIDRINDAINTARKAAFGASGVIQHDPAAWQDKMRANVGVVDQQQLRAAKDERGIRAEVQRGSIESPVTMIRYEITNKSEESSRGHLNVLKTAYATIIDLTNQTEFDFQPWFCSSNDIDYEEKDLLDEGTFGRVYQGDSSDGSNVVVKVLLANGDHARQVFDKELAIWYPLKHPHISKLIGACHLTSPLFFVSAKAEKGNFVHYFRNHGTSQIWRLFHEVAQGLSYLHMNKVVHGNLKCTNLLVRESGRAEICDFGFSYIRSASVGLSAKTQANEVRWKAPETMMQSDNTDAPNPRWASDVYSLGLCIWEAFEGEAPFGTEDDDEVIAHLFDEKFEMPTPKDIPENQWQFVKRMLHHDWEQRVTLNLVIAKLREYKDAEAELATACVKFIPTETTNFSGRYSKYEKRSSNIPSSWLIPPFEIEVESFIDDGHTGGYYHGKWLDADVVVKLFVHNAASSTFVDEVCLWRQLRHPNILKLYGVCNFHHLFFVCEYASNGSLPEYLKSCDAEHQTPWKFLYEAALGLEYLHERKIVHGNLRGNNVLIGTDGLAKLSGFGLSASPLERRLFNSGAWVRWAPPESLRGEQLSFASDVYSLGMCTMEAVSGDVPFYELTEEIVKRMKNDETSKHMIRSSSQLVCLTKVQMELVLAMCRDNPRGRLQMRAVVSKLERFAEVEAAHYYQISEPEVHFDYGEFETVQMKSLWKKVQEMFEKSENSQYRQIHNKMELIHDTLKAKSHPWSIFESFQDQVVECRDALDTILRQNRASRRSSTRPKVHSVEGLHRRITQLLQLVRPQDHDAKLQETERKRLCREQVKVLVSEASEAGVMLSMVDSDEDRMALVAVLHAELRNSDGKYNDKQLMILQRTYDDIISKSLEDLQLVTTHEWFIPWFELELNEMEMLGEGGFASVIKAKWLDSEVVVKKLELASKDAENDDNKREMWQMFEREVDIWFGLSHPHVVRLFGACHVGKPFFVCELAPNGTLVEYLRRHPDEIWVKLREAALGVRYLHSRGIVHGDLKGNNIMVGSDGKAKVTDFGLSSVLGDDSLDGVVNMAWNWVAPECILGDQSTFASDIYSFGMCIIEALRVAFGHEYTLPWGKLPNIAVKFHVTKKYTLPLRPYNCSDEAWDLIVGMCSSNPARRMHIMTVVDRLEMLAERDGNLIGEMDDIASDIGKLQLSPSSVADELTKMKIWIANRDPRSDWEGGVLEKIYLLLWNRLEQVATKLFPDGDDTIVTKTTISDFTFVVDHLKQRTLEGLGITGDTPLIKFTELALGGYALHRRLDKFMSAHAVSKNSNSLHDWMSACNSIMNEGANFSPNYMNEGKIANEASMEATLTLSSMKVACETKPALSTEANFPLATTQVSARDIDDSMGVPVTTDIESNIAESQQQIETMQLPDQLEQVDPDQESSSELSVVPPSPSVDDGSGQPPSVLYQPQQSHEVADQFQEMMNETSLQMVIFRHLVQRLFTAVTQANAQSVDNYALRGFTGLVEQVFEAFVVFRCHFDASIADVLQAPVLVTRIRAYHLELDKLEQICGFENQGWEEKWRSDCEAFVRVLRGLELEYVSGDEEETNHIDEENERAAQFIRGKYIASMPQTEKSLMTQLFEDYLTTSDEVVKFQKWFVPIAECQQYPRLPDVHIWNDMKVKIRRFSSNSKEHQQLCREHADRMASLTHPRIVRLLGACDVGVPFFVVENIESMSFAGYVKECSPSRDDIWLAIFDVALALQWLHERGVMCDTLSSSCIVVDSDGRGRLDLHSSQRDYIGSVEQSETQFGRLTTTAADVCRFASCIHEAFEHFGGAILDIGQHLLSDMMNDDPNLRPPMEVVVTEMFRLIQPDPQWSPRFESFVIELEPSAWNDLRTACSLYTRGSELFRIVIGYIERLIETDNPNMPSFLRTSIASYLAFIQQYICSPAVVQLAQVRHMMQSTQRLLEQVDDFLNQKRAEHCQQGVWETPFSIHCKSLVQEWMEWLQDADAIKAITCDDVLTALTMIKYEWDTHFRVLSASVQDLIGNAFGVVSGKAGVCVMATAPWFIPPYQISHSRFNNERVMVKKMPNDEQTEIDVPSEHNDKVANKVVEQATLWSKLYHPNILRFVGASHVGDPYMVFEASSSTLRKQPADQREIWCRLHEAAMGLEYLHSQGVTHGQLKCEAIVICDGSSFEKDHSVAKLVSTDLVSRKARYKSGLGTSSLGTDLHNFARCIVEAITKKKIDKTGDDFVAEVVARGLHDQMGNEAWGLVRNMLSAEFGGLSYVVETLANIIASGSQIELKSPRVKRSPKKILAAMLDERMMDLKKQLTHLGSEDVGEAFINDISEHLEQFGAEIAMYAASKRSTTITYLALHQKLDELMEAEEWRSFSSSELHNWEVRFREITASS